MEETESPSKLSPLEKDIRKIRKKLRQIESLELVDRELNEEEQIKVNSKTSLRKELRSLLENILPEDDDDIMKRQSPCADYSNIAEKKAKNTVVVKSEVPDITNPDTGRKEEVTTLNTNISRADNLETSTALRGKDSTKKKRAQENIPIGVSEAQGNSLSISVKGNPNQVRQESLTKAAQEKSLWKDSSYEVYTLEGHNDIILSVDCTDEFIISASRDTTVKVWRVSETKEERSLRGHTASVTAVAFLPVELAYSLLRKFEDDPESMPFSYSKGSPDCRVLAVSGSLDCTLRVWDISTGESFGSIYTYNGITVMQCANWGAVTGTEGGKLEVWCLVKGNRHTFTNAFQCQVTALICEFLHLTIENDHIYAGSTEGDIGIWQYNTSSRTLSAVFVMELESEAYVPLKCLSTLVGIGGVLFLGDSGPNIKVLDWKKGSVTRLRNHRGDIGMTDSIAVAADGHLLSSSYCIDTGHSSINVRKSATGNYICSLVDTDEGRYLALRCSPGIIVTGGHLLKVWIQGEKRSGQKTHGKEVINPKFYQKLSAKAADSASEDDTDWASSSDEDRDLDEDTSKTVSSDAYQPASSWWCSIFNFQVLLYMSITAFITCKYFHVST
ncbi:uncharacterized protein [Macrobrachium rosenbergii]|uniref:uncharacterized protein n=1 Tax=Macrobrachium rosenbergii TaxID=79674 RepID=UPI0034D78FEA